MSASDALAIQSHQRKQSNSIDYVDLSNARASKRLTNRSSSQASDAAESSIRPSSNSSSRRATSRASNRLSSKRPISSEGFNKAHAAPTMFVVRQVSTDTVSHSSSRAIISIAPGNATHRTIHRSRKTVESISGITPRLQNIAQLVTDQPIENEADRSIDKANISLPDNISPTDVQSVDPSLVGGGRDSDQSQFGRGSPSEATRPPPLVIASPVVQKIQVEAGPRNSPYRLSMIDMDSALFSRRASTHGTSNQPLDHSHSISRPSTVPVAELNGHRSTVHVIDERLRGQELDQLSNSPSIDSVNQSAPFPPPKESDPIAATTKTETPQEPAELPKSACARVVSTAIGTLALAIIYLPFTLAILLQSTYIRRSILPKDHATELSLKFWGIALGIFAFMITFPFIMNFAILTNYGLWSIFNNDIVDAIPFTFCFAFYLFLLCCLHLMTLHYAYMRPDLRIIHNLNQAINLRRLSTWLCIFSIMFETFQLNSPYLSPERLGLQGVDNMYSRWLGSMHDGFGISEWRSSMKSGSVIPAFWAAFVIVVLYALMLGYGIVSDLQPEHKLGWTLFELIPGVFYLTITGRILQVFNCQPDGDEGGGFHLTNDPSVICWATFYHRSLTMAAFMALLFYSSVAMFVAAYRGDAAGHPENPKFKPVYLVFERTMRGLFAITTSLISDIQLGRALGIVIIAALMITTLVSQPCSVPTLGRFKVLSHLTAFWLLFCSFLPAMFRSLTDWFDAQVPLMIVAGWAAFLLIYCCLEVNDYFTRRLEMHPGTKRTPTHIARGRAVAPYSPSPQPSSDYSNYSGA